MGRELLRSTSRCSPRRSTRCALVAALDRPLRDVMFARCDGAGPDGVHAAGAVRASRSRCSGCSESLGRRHPTSCSVTRSARSPPPTSPACCPWPTRHAGRARAGRLMQALPAGGAMVAVERHRGRGRTAARPTRWTIAAVNGPDSGRALRRRGRGRRRRRTRWERRQSSGCAVSHAFHSPHDGPDARRVPRRGRRADVPAAPRSRSSPPSTGELAESTGRRLLGPAGPRGRCGSPTRPAAARRRRRPVPRARPGRRARPRWSRRRRRPRRAAAAPDRPSRTTAGSPRWRSLHARHDVDWRRSSQRRRRRRRPADLPVPAPALLAGLAPRRTPTRRRLGLTPGRPPAARRGHSPGRQRRRRCSPAGCRPRPAVARRPHDRRARSWCPAPRFVELALRAGDQVGCPASTS